MQTESRPWRLLIMMGGFGFCSGLPLPLTVFTLQQWFATYHMSLHAIGLTSWIGLSYTLKFLWSGLFDRPAPWQMRRFGRRRGWLLVVQPALALACLGLAWSDPGARPLGTVLAAIVLAFLSASQDILIDAWRIEVFAPAAQGAALAVYVWGYRLAMVVADAGVIFLSTRIGWGWALSGVAGLLALGTMLSWAAPEPALALATPRGESLAARLRQAVAPLAEFLGRPGALWVLAFVLLFRLGKVYADGTAAGFYRYQLGFSSVQVADANALSLLGTLSGAALGGLLVARLGAIRALLLAGCGQALSLGLYLVLLASGPHTGVLATKVVLEFFAGAAADTAFLSYISLLCSKAYTATQYALLSSLAAVALHTLGGFSGYVAEGLGYAHYYLLCMVCGVPALLILARLRRISPVP